MHLSEADTDKSESDKDKSYKNTLIARAQKLGVA